MSTGQDQRDKLFDRAKVGEITGDEADAEAIRLGLGSLSHTPAPEEFRPEAETQWTIPMAVAWIAYLDLDEVREWSAPFREACTHWIWRRWRTGLDGPVHEGWFLEDRSRPTLALLGMGAAFDQVEGGRELQMTVAEAREALWIALREGFFVASGIDFETDRRTEIPALDWNELVPVQGKGEIDEVRRGLLGTGYRNVLVPSASLRGHWRRVTKPVLTLPQTMSPTGHGYMPLFCAAQWIATEGGSVDVDPAEVETWRQAYADLLAAIASGDVSIVGVNGHQPQLVPPHLFVGIEVDYPYVESTLELMLSNELVLRSYPYVDDKHWRDGFDDALVDRGGDRWRRLSVQKRDIGRLWEFATEIETATGLPGRPALSKHLIDDEMQRRASVGALAPSLREEAVALLAWLRSTHPKHAPPTVRTIENNVREDYRKLKATK